MPRYMEDNLNMHLHSVLRMMQSRIVNKTSYMGIHTTKNPLDMWVYQEIIYETKPDVIIEIGCGRGGSSLCLANLCNNINHGRVLGIDVDLWKHPRVIDHPRIKLLEGDANQLIDKVKELTFNCKDIMVIEDSSHTYDNTLDLLRFYSPFVREDNYFIVEDSNCYHGINRGPYPGPYEAIETFLQENPDFESDREKESFFITWNPKGYLRRRK